MPRPAPTPECESERLDALRSYQILDTPAEAAFDRITSIASDMANAPMSLVSLVDADRHWFKARRGVAAPEIPREIGICGYTILNDEVLLVPDASNDDRFADSPLVTGEPHIRTYAGAPLITRDGFRLGTLCVLYDEVTALGDPILAQLERLASLVVDEMDLRVALREAEEARVRADAANAAKSAFLASMSHEIRTPMNGVLGMASALENTPLTDAQRHMVTTITTSGDALLAILNDILDIAKIEAGKLELDETEFDLVELIGTVCGLYRHTADEHGVGLGASVHPHVRGHYRGDVARIRQILNNLMSNALKFTESGEVALTVAPGESFGRRGVLFSVRDTGVGISSEYLAEAFTPFSQEDVSTTRKYGGTGLGLAICRQLCELMGGWIDAESMPGRGSLFRVMLPLERVDDSDTASPPGESAPVAAPAEHADAGERAFRVLAVEDNEANRSVLDAMLGQFEIDVEFAHNGQAGVTAWEGGAFDLILMDIRMPVMDGLEATRIIRARERETGRRRTPIIALSADAMPEQVDEQLSAGADMHLSKPVRARELFMAIQAAVDTPSTDGDEAD